MGTRGGNVGSLPPTYDSRLIDLSDLRSKSIGLQALWERFGGTIGFEPFDLCWSIRDWRPDMGGFLAIGGFSELVDLCDEGDFSARFGLS